MVKDPLDNGRTQEFEFPEVSFEETPELVVTPVAEEPPEFTPMADEKIQEALAKLRQRSFSGRNPTLGKMIKCPFCRLRHRQTNVIIRETRTDDGRKAMATIYLSPCSQTFTFVRGGYEYFREGENGELVPDFSTAIDPAFTPTARQQNGAPRPSNFSLPRYHPHHNPRLLQLVERTRLVFTDMGFTETKGEQAQKNMHLAKTEAGCQLSKERKARAKAKRKQQKRSRRINRGR